VLHQRRVLELPLQRLKDGWGALGDALVQPASPQTRARDLTKICGAATSVGDV